MVGAHEYCTTYGADECCTVDEAHEYSAGNGAHEDCIINEAHE